MLVIWYALKILPCCTFVRSHELLRCKACAVSKYCSRSCQVSHHFLIKQVNILPSTEGFEVVMSVLVIDPIYMLLVNMFIVHVARYIWVNCFILKIHDLDIDSLQISLNCWNNSKTECSPWIIEWLRESSTRAVKGKDEQVVEAVVNAEFEHDQRSWSGWQLPSGAQLYWEWHKRDQPTWCCIPGLMICRSQTEGIHRQVSGFSGNDNGFGHRHSGKPLFDGDDPRFSDLCAHRSEAGATTLSWQAAAVRRPRVT